MEKQELLKTLGQLHAELDRADAVDEENRKHLATLTEDIRRLSDQPNAEGPGPVEP